MSDKLQQKVITKAVSVAFDANGEGRFNVPNGYHTIGGYYDSNWALLLYGNNLCRCHRVGNFQQIITNTTGNAVITFALD